ncbi:MAG: glycosyltransferase [Pseudomonadota bacterium]|nr:glycosyltransferase [Pseudomonadota bacterium]
MKHVLSISTLYPNEVNPRFGTFVARSLEALARQNTAPASAAGWRVTVVNPLGIPPIAFGRYKELADLPDQQEAAGITVHRPHFTLIPKFGARRNAKAIAKAVLPIARRIHAETPIDVIDAQFFFPDGPAARIVAEELGLPFSIKARGSDINYWGRFDFAREQMLDAAKSASGLLSVSDALRKEMVALGIEHDKIALHYTGLDRDRFRPLGHDRLRSQLGERLATDLPAHSPLFACVGALNHRKGHDIAIRALAMLEELPESRVLIVGKGEEEGDLRALAKKLGVADRVHLTGSIDHDLLPIILSAADAMVLPTENEGLANAWVESLACGTPVITTDVGGAKELITSRTAGLLVERDPEEIVSAMREVLASPPDPQAVAAMVERFDWKTHAQELAEYYSQLSAP